MSGNHNHSLERAKDIIAAAADAGADAIKLQTYTPDTLTIDCDNDYFQVKVNDAWAGNTLYNLYKSAYTPWEWHRPLKEFANERGLVFFSSPFDETAVNLLEELEVPLYKVASFEIGHIPLLRMIGATKKPVIISRGLADAVEIERAIATLLEAGSPQVVLLHCVSAYPARFADMNISTIPELARRFGVVAGLSDHTLGVTVPIAAVTLGAHVIEKHFTLRRSEGGPDASFSLEPEEFKTLVRSVREAEASYGTPTYDSGTEENENRVFKRSIFVVCDIAEGEALTPENIRIIRPGYGMSPHRYDEVLGKRTLKELKRGTPLKDDCLA